MSEAQLYARLEELDPEKAKVIDRHNRRRLVRALEIATSAPSSPPIPSLRAIPPLTPPSQEGNRVSVPPPVKEGMGEVLGAEEISGDEESAGEETLSKGPAHYNALVLAIEMPREDVYKRINERVDRMMKDGLLEEVKKLGEKYGYDGVAMSAVGYQQIGWHLQGKMSLAESIELIKKATRHYAKRQMTWWKKHGEVVWVADTVSAMEKVANFLK